MIPKCKTWSKSSAQLDMAPKQKTKQLKSILGRDIVKWKKVKTESSIKINIYKKKYALVNQLEHNSIEDGFSKFGDFLD